MEKIERLKDKTGGLLNTVRRKGTRTDEKTRLTTAVQEQLPNLRLLFKRMKRKKIREDVHLGAPTAFKGKKPNLTP